MHNNNSTFNSFKDSVNEKFNLPKNNNPECLYFIYSILNIKNKTKYRKIASRKKNRFKILDFDKSNEIGLKPKIITLRGFRNIY